MNPLTIKPLILVAAILAAFAAGSGTGWTANGWRLHAQLAAEKGDRASEKADQAVATVVTLQADAKTINKAASEFLAAQSKLAPQIAALQKDVKNAKPLNPDCRPDPVRVRVLDAGIDAANASAARQ